MNRSRLTAFATAASVAIGAAFATAPSANAKPTTRGAERATERAIERYNRPMVRKGWEAFAGCKKSKTTKREIRYRCSWTMVGGNAFELGYSGGEIPRGTTWTYANRRGKTRYRVVRTR
ncbi:MAG: hypothetical protein M0P31_16970 [Solirubrobacteraceae bacterium]|nr:hypothetical protein [Solirubrobacteraceae bacterium]